jgi:putative transposase
MSARIDLLDRSKGQTLSIRAQCELLSINRSSVYLKPTLESSLNLELLDRIDKEHLNDPTKGVLRMTSFLNRMGYDVNSKRVRRLMRLMCIDAIYPKKNLSKLGKAEYIMPYLLRNLPILKPNQVWAIDISYIPMKRGFMYLTALMDVHSRFIVGWDLSNSLEAETQTKTLSEAIKIHSKPDIINSDQGAQYTSKIWHDCIHYHEIKMSMDGKGRATDNAFIERFFRTIKQEYIYLNVESDSMELYKGIDKFIQHYNQHRTHQGINNQVPFEVYTQKGILIDKEKRTKKETTIVNIMV